MTRVTRHPRAFFHAGLSSLGGLAPRAMGGPAMLVASIVALAPRMAYAVNYSHSMCLTGRVDTQDRMVSGATAINWKLRGVPVSVYRSDALIFAGSTNISTGCVTFVDTATSGYTVWTSTQATVGSVSSYQIRAHGSQSARDNDIVSLYATTSVTATCTGTSCSTNLTYGAGVDGAIIGIAVAAWALQERMDPQVGVIQDAAWDDEVLHVTRASCGIGGDYSCNTGQGVKFHAPRKFLLGHELGHHFDARFGDWGGYGGAYGFALDDDPPPNQAFVSPSCKWYTAYESDGGHALRSQEVMGAAYKEGFAHFISTYLFQNSTVSSTRFKYYKDCDAWSCAYYEYDEVNPNGGSSQGGVINFLESTSGCSCDLLSSCDDAGTELDWLRSLWQFYRNSGTAPTLRQIFEQQPTGGQPGQSCNTDDSPPLLLPYRACSGELWLTLLTNTPSTLQARWSTVSSLNGVDQ